MNPSVLITIVREEIDIEVSVEILEVTGGSNDSDDPLVVETDQYGYTEEGESYELTANEMDDAGDMYLRDVADWNQLWLERNL